MAEPTIAINRAPVLTLWAATVAERLGYSSEEALSLGKAVAGLTAQAKGRSIGMYEQKPPPATPPAPGSRGEELWVTLCGKAVPAKHTPKGLRAVSGADALEPEPVTRYLEKAFGDMLPAARQAFVLLAQTLDPRDPPDTLSNRARELYERFRPEVPKGQAGWGVQRTTGSWPHQGTCGQ